MRGGIEVKIIKFLSFMTTLFFCLAFIVAHISWAVEDEMGAIFSMMHALGLLLILVFLAIIDNMGGDNETP